MKKIVLPIMVLICGNCIAQTNKISVDFIQPEMTVPQGYMQSYIKVKDFNLNTLRCSNGEKPQIHSKSEIYTKDLAGIDPERIIQGSIIGSILIKMLDVNNKNASANVPITIGTAVAQEGLLKYSEKLPKEERESLLTKLAGTSVGFTANNLMMALGSSSPVGFFIGVTSGWVSYSNTLKHYEDKKDHEKMYRVYSYIDHPLDSTKVYTCDVE